MRVCKTQGLDLLTAVREVRKGLDLNLITEMTLTELQNCPCLSLNYNIWKKPDIFVGPTDP